MIVRNSRLRARVAQNVAAKCNPLMIGPNEWIGPVDTETAVFHRRTGHLNKEGLLCTRWLSDPSPTTRSFDRTAESLSLSLSLYLSLSLPLLVACRCSTSTQSTPSSINEPASIYSLLHRPNPDFPPPRLAIRPTPSRRFTRFDRKKSGTNLTIRRMIRGCLIIHRHPPDRSSLPSPSRNPRFANASRIHAVSRPPPPPRFRLSADEISPESFLMKLTRMTARDRREMNYD